MMLTTSVALLLMYFDLDLPWVQELANQVRFLEDADEGSDSDGDLATLHVALREIVDACDNKAAQLYALQQL